MFPNKTPFYKRTVGGLAHLSSQRRNSAYRLEQPAPQVLLPIQEQAELGRSQSSVSSSGSLSGEDFSPLATTPKTSFFPYVPNDVVILNNGDDYLVTPSEPLEPITVSRMDEELIEDIVDLQQQIDALRTEVAQEKARPMSAVWESTAAIKESPQRKSLDDALVLPVDVSSRPGGARQSPVVRRHFHYSHANYSRDDGYGDSSEDSDEEDMVSCIREALRCFKARRRRARALIDLVGIEPNPGPGGKKKPQAKKQKTVTKVIEVSRPKARQRSAMQFLSGHEWNPRRDLSAYMMTLCDAEKHPPVRLGGETMVQTALTTLHAIFPLTLVNSSASVIFHPRLWNPLLTSQSTTAGVYNYSYAGSFWPAPAVAQLSSLGAGARVVSCKLKVIPLASATNDAGAITVGLCPRDDGFLGGYIDISNIQAVDNNAGAPFINAVSSGGFPILQTVYNSIGQNTSNGTVYPYNSTATQGSFEFPSYDFTDTIPLKDGAAVFWLPEDSQTFTFAPDRLRQTKQFVSTTSSTVANVATAGQAGNATPIMDPFFLVGVQGAAVGTIVNIEVYLNLEYTVTSGASGIIETTAGVLSENQLLSVVRRVGGNLQNTVEPNPEASLGDKLMSAGKSVVRSGIGGVSKFLFGSSDIGGMVSDLIGL